MSKKKSRWVESLQYFRMKYDKGRSSRLVWRGDLLRILGHSQTVENYRNYLTKAGYLKHVDTGLYLVVKPIPVGLKLADVLTAAYPVRFRRNIEAASAPTVTPWGVEIVETYD